MVLELSGIILYLYFNQFPESLIFGLSTLFEENTEITLTNINSIITAAAIQRKIAH